MGLFVVVGVCVGEVCNVSGLCGCVGVVGGGGAGGGLGGSGWGGWWLYRLGWLWLEEVCDRSLVQVKGVISGDDI